MGHFSAASSTITLLLFLFPLTSKYYIVHTDRSAYAPMREEKRFCRCDQNEALYSYFNSTIIRELQWPQEVDTSELIQCLKLLTQYFSNIKYNVYVHLMLSKPHQPTIFKYNYKVQYFTAGSKFRYSSISEIS